ncbi:MULTISPECIES: flagellar export protein FliJ [unclassified Herbaspirillum]|uniref:flagellar export protein FliJ n=1 Tax=unclassified Herbaspirillum TaxID=2624150 RepID=UPI0011541818|nr:MULTISPECIES: flagellar export protein FliJ [unclassified Herbaspirillum]MBB5392926.1 flagellar FliJ protein [Herbaspirillum sp. SJZ102]TQK04428.1 flagellar FliJ protein [Herbaspirillum sp. SJZ130]TQK09787.1 flagellar FliJ protein [Herbaspirillum sp. SJZ106]TWC65863.1 flagellar FliJ protein [Herbaspirillum sp. SJZ099]
MATPSALETLIDLATKETDEATKRLGRAIRVGEEAQQKLAILQQYRDDYAARFQETLTTGLTALSYRNFQLFIEKIDTAITGQQDVVYSTQQKVADARLAWQACERKRMSYDTLATRAREKQLQQENRRDQKTTDEHASRITFYKR